ncbi:MAG TPA: DMT family transporter [Bacteroidia bacterium]|jgi:drug/metabolite transporter (DMT)-like permease
MPSSYLYLGEIIAIVTTISWSIGIFPFTEAARRLGPDSVNHFRLVLAVMLLTIISLLFLPVSLTGLFTEPLAEHWLWFGLSGVIGLALGDHFAFTSFAILGARVSSVFTTLSPAAALFTGYFVIGERINAAGTIGILVTIAGVIWLTLSKKAKSEMRDHEQGSKEKGIFYGMLSAVCQGVGIVLANKGFTYPLDGTALPFFQATWLRMISATVVIFTVTAFRGKIKEYISPVLVNRNKGVPYTIAGTIFGPVIGVSLSMLAVSLLHNKPSVAQTIFSLVPIFALPLAFFFYNEKITYKSLLGALIAITGVIILIWREELSTAITNLLF